MEARRNPAWKSGTVTEKTVNVVCGFYHTTFDGQAVFKRLGAIPQNARHASLYDSTKPLVTARHRALLLDPGCPAILISTVDLGRGHRTVFICYRCAKVTQGTARHRALSSVHHQRTISVRSSDAERCVLRRRMETIVSDGPQFFKLY